MTKAQIKKAIAQDLGIGIHTAFRKATDCNESVTIWRAIRSMPDDEYRSVIDFVADGIAGILAAELKAEAKGAK
jgi:hypothetical protein